MLWRKEKHTHQVVIKSLLKYELDDQQIVVLPQANRSIYQVFSIFWKHTACVIAWWRKNNHEFTDFASKIQLILVKS